MKPLIVFAIILHISLPTLFQEEVRKYRVNAYELIVDAEDGQIQPMLADVAVSALAAERMVGMEIILTENMITCHWPDGAVESMTVEKIVGDTVIFNDGRRQQQTLIIKRSGRYFHLEIDKRYRYICSKI